MGSGVLKKKSGTAAKKYKVGISGSFGGLNLGDEAILCSMIAGIRASLHAEITVFSKNPDDTLKRQKVDRAIAVRKLSRDQVLPEIQRLDIFILGGGGILFDGEVKQYLREVQFAHELGIPVMTYAIGAGPLNDTNNQKLVREALNRAALVTVREHSVKKILEDAGVNREIIVTADPALLLRPEPLPRDVLKYEGLQEKDRLICISVREPGAAAPDINQDSYHALIANASDYMVDRYGAHVVFIPMERAVLDMQHAHAVISQMLRPQKATVLQGNYTSSQMLSLMKHFVFAVGMRLHFIIFAAIQNVPFVSLPYASKVFGFLEDLKIEAPPLHLVNSGRLIAYIDRCWDGSRRLQLQVRKALPQLLGRAQRTNLLLIDLLTQQLCRGNRASS